MKEKKFSIEIIEKGRLSREESNKLFGGDVYKPLCDGDFISEPCYQHIFCSRVKPGQIGYVNCPDGPDGAFSTCLDSYKSTL